MTLSRSIRETLLYSDYFGFPLTEDELHSRLMKIRVSRRSLRTAVREMEGNEIEVTGKYIHLKGRRANVVRREKRERLSVSLMQKAVKWSHILGRFPGVRAVYVTGSLAVGNTDGHDDIDFMIVAENGRLWTVRLILTLATSILGLRRTPNSANNAGKICLNLYLTPACFEIPESKKSVYTAYELIQAVPVYDPHSTHSQLLQANTWIKEYLPNISRLRIDGSGISAHREAAGLARMIEKWAYALQKKYMARRRTREYVTEGSAFFHPDDPGEIVLKKIKR